ncbi:MAG TPA: NAD(P)-dependent oxidoreductase [Solirubrobacteraceae bacterium]|nr:NAD(P)-dependent oxidoreductase [Solirubrobacteraceae bacterium]
MRRVLLTGAAGSIATAVRPVLRELAADVVLTDRVDVAAVEPGERFARAELEDPAPWDGLAAGCDAIVHLGAVPDEAPFDVLAGPNLRGAFHVYEAARRAGVRRVVVASSGRATGFYRVGERLDGGVTPRPDGLYAATKAFSEALGRMYADKFGLEVVALRIGTFEERPRTTRDLSTWLSHDDARRLVRVALTGPVDGFVCVYGVSANTRGWWDLPPSLGYVPLDDAEDYAGDVAPDDGIPFQGGPSTARESGGWAA